MANCVTTCRTIYRTRGLGQGTRSGVSVRAGSVKRRIRHFRQRFAFPVAMVASGMARILIVGSSTGLGLMAAQLLVEQGHQVVLHARNAERVTDARNALPQANVVVIGEVTSIAGAKHVAHQANELGRFDGVIHNVAFRLPGVAAHRDGRRPAAGLRGKHTRSIFCPP